MGKKKRRWIKKKKKRKEKKKRKRTGTHAQVVRGKSRTLSHHGKAAEQSVLSNFVHS